MSVTMAQEFLNALVLGVEKLIRAVNPLLILLGFIILYAVRVITNRILEEKRPPGPRALPLIGNMHQLGPNLHQVLWHLAQKHGPIMYLRMGAAPLVVASSAEVAKEFVKIHDKDWAGRPPSITGEIFSNNYSNIVGTPYGPLLRHLRKICTLELLTQKRLESFRPSRVEEFDHMVKSMYEDSVHHTPVKLIVKLSHLATNNITRMLLNKRIFGVSAEGEMEAERFKKVIEKTLTTISNSNVVGDFVPWLKWIFYASGYVAHMKKVKADLDSFLQELLDLKKSNAGNIDQGSGERQEDFVDVLLGQKSETGNEQLNDESIRGVIQDMLTAGTDTTSNTVEWAIAELIRHPHCMHKLQAELHAVVGKERVVTEADIPKLPYLQAIVKEVARLYPPAPLFVPHESVEPTTVLGYKFPAGTRLFVNCYAIHRDPRYWENPLQFDPERFVRNPEIDMKGNHLQLIPFGVGRRQCPGMSLGILFVSFGIARLVQAFDFALPGEQDPSTLDMTENFGITNPMANPLVVMASPRLEAHLY